MILYAVIDTNILVSALLTSNPTSTRKNCNAHGKLLKECAHQPPHTALQTCRWRKLMRRSDLPEEESNTNDKTPSVISAVLRMGLMHFILGDNALDSRSSEYRARTGRHRQCSTG